MHTISVVPQDVAWSLERAKIEQELLRNHAAELKAATWWKAFLLRRRIAREADRVYWRRVRDSRSAPLKKRI